MTRDVSVHRLSGNQSKGVTVVTIKKAARAWICGAAMPAIRASVMSSSLRRSPLSRLRQASTTAQARRPRVFAER